MSKTFIDLGIILRMNRRRNLINGRTRPEQENKGKKEEKVKGMEVRKKIIIRMKFLILVRKGPPSR